MEMNQTLARQIENAFPKWIRYGMMPNPNMKYHKQGYRTLIVAVFPYSYPQKTTAFSKYASIPDYHRVVKEELAAIFDQIGVEYVSFTDISPFIISMIRFTSASPRPLPCVAWEVSP